MMSNVTTGTRAVGLRSRSGITSLTLVAVPARAAVGRSCSGVHREQLVEQHRPRDGVPAATGGELVRLFQRVVHVVELRVEAGREVAAPNGLWVETRGR